MSGIRIVRCTGTLGMQGHTAGVPGPDGSRQGQEPILLNYPAPQGLFEWIADFGMFARLRNVETGAELAWRKNQLEDIEDSTDS